MMSICGGLISGPCLHLLGGGDEELCEDMIPQVHTLV